MNCEGLQGVEDSWGYSEICQGKKRCGVGGRPEYQVKGKEGIKAERPEKRGGVSCDYSSESKKENWKRFWRSIFASLIN